ncbi:MAG: protein kinase [Vicinamibacterales bacterium]
MIPGTRVGSYEVVGRLGVGGMGEVYLARDARLDREVALKVLPSHLAQDAGTVARFRREALALASLNHPNLATVYGFEQAEDGTSVLVLERVEGVTLQARLAEGPLPVDEALRLCAQLAEALEVAHQQGVIHRDIKPGNIMIGPRGLLKVLDFGLARRAGVARAPGAQPPSSAGAGFTSPDSGSLPGVNASPPSESTIGPTGTGPGADADTLVRTLDTQVPAPPSSAESMSGLAVGTPGYMSPEQVLAQDVDHRTDVFAFGCVLYECLAGRRAFPGDTPQAAMHAVLDTSARLDALPAGTPAPLRALVERCLARRPADRAESMHAVRLEIEEWLGLRRSPVRTVTPNNLPTPATGFVGRGSILSACLDALANARLLTLLGIGGTGKTRLVLRLAEVTRDSFPHGIWFVDVAPLAEPERLLESLAEVLAVPDEPGRPLLAGVIDKLSGQRVLLVFDNAETQLDACATLADALLAGSPSITLVVTSRQPLGVDTETTFLVPTLGVPPASTATAADALTFESVELFVQRARVAMPAFDLSDLNVHDVVEICRRLDGIPLALELAAARLRMLAIGQVRARLDDRFRLLTRGSSGAPTRQQAVLTVVQWSWDQLQAPEQDLLRRLAVFTGGWTLAHAVEVCSDSGDEFEILDLLTRLAERSMIVVRHEDGALPRYGFLETVWKFALGKLEAHPEYDALRTRHFESFFATVQKVAPLLIGPEQARAFKELAPEEENLLAALTWSGHVRDGVQRGLTMAVSVYRLFSSTSRYSAGLRTLEEQLARDTERTPTHARALALLRAGGSAISMGELERARPAFDEALSISRALADDGGVARALNSLSALAHLGEEPDQARAMAVESLDLYQRIGTLAGVAMVRHNLGMIEASQGHYPGAVNELESAAVLTRQIGNPSSIALSLCALAAVLLRNGEPARAADRLRECFSCLDGLNAQRESMEALEAVADWLLTIGRAAEAAPLFAAADQVRQTLRLSRNLYERRDHERWKAALLSALGPDEYVRLERAGAAMPFDRALSAARALLGVDS